MAQTQLNVVMVGPKHMQQFVTPLNFGELLKILEGSRREGVWICVRPMGSNRAVVSENGRGFFTCEMVNGDLCWGRPVVPGMSYEFPP